MAMEKQYSVRDTHTRSITAIGYNPVRREIVLGFEGKKEVGWLIDCMTVGLLLVDDDYCVSMA